jgi:hypothetical protein
MSVCLVQAARRPRWRFAVPLIAVPLIAVAACAAPSAAKSGGARAAVGAARVLDQLAPGQVEQGLVSDGQRYAVWSRGPTRLAVFDATTVTVSQFDLPGHDCRPVVAHAGLLLVSCDLHSGGPSEQTVGQQYVRLLAAKTTRAIPAPPPPRHVALFGFVGRHWLEGTYGVPNRSLDIQGYLNWRSGAYFEVQTRAPSPSRDREFVATYDPPRDLDTSQPRRWRPYAPYVGLGIAHGGPHVFVHPTGGRGIDMGRCEGVCASFSLSDDLVTWTQSPPGGDGGGGIAQAYSVKRNRRINLTFPTAANTSSLTVVPAGRYALAEISSRQSSQATIYIQRWA